MQNAHALRASNFVHILLGGSIQKREPTACTLPLLAGCKEADHKTGSAHPCM